MGQGIGSAPRILRPLLEVSRSEIEVYARRNQLHWITDESNADIAFDRNFLRHEIFLYWKGVSLPIAQHFYAPVATWRRHPACWMSWLKLTAKVLLSQENSD